MKALSTLSLLICMLSFSTIGRAQKATKTLTPIEFSDHMSDLTDSLYKKGSDWWSHYVAAKSARNFASLKSYRIAVETFLVKSTKELKSMPDVSNSTALRMAMIHFMEFERTMVTKGFMPIEKIPSTGSDEEMDKAFADLQQMAKVESVELEKVSKEQNAYAKANGFKIESKDEGGEE